MKNTNLFSSICAFCFFILIFGCQKVIQVDLNAAPNKLVIEGNITDQPGPQMVKLTKSIPFDQPNTYPGISGALVIIKDNLGLVDTLSDQGNGIYLTKSWSGVSGRTYELFVSLNSDTYTAISKMPTKINFDSLGLTYIPFGGKSSAFATPYFRDGKDLGESYRFILNVNGKQDPTNVAWNDNVGNGRWSNQPIIPNNNDQELKSGDSILVEMQCIDANIYNYYFTLFNTDQGVTPANPPTNIKGSDALGYFSAHTVQKKSLRIP